MGSHPSAYFKLSLWPSSPGSGPQNLAGAQFVKWLMDHQKEAGVFTAVSDLVQQLSDNPAARMTAQEIAERVEKAQQSRSVATTMPAGA